jgi:hypothetical protein
MTRDLTEALRRGYDALWRDGDLDAAVAGFPPDFEWVVPGHPEGDVRRGMVFNNDADKAKAAAGVAD